MHSSWTTTRRGSGTRDRHPRRGRRRKTVNALRYARAQHPRALRARGMFIDHCRASSVRIHASVPSFESHQHYVCGEGQNVSSLARQRSWAAEMNEDNGIRTTGDVDGYPMRLSPLRSSPNRCSSRRRASCSICRTWCSSPSSCATLASKVPARFDCSSICECCTRSHRKPIVLLRTSTYYIALSFVRLTSSHSVAARPRFPSGKRRIACRH
jgi:hypothetical protein